MMNVWFVQPWTMTNIEKLVNFFGKITYIYMWFRSCSCDFFYKEVNNIFFLCLFSSVFYHANMILDHFFVLVASKIAAHEMINKIKILTSQSKFPHQKPHLMCFFLFCFSFLFCPNHANGFVFVRPNAAIRSIIITTNI